MDSTIIQGVQDLATREQRPYWLGWPPSGRPRLADNPETLEQQGCTRLRRIDPERPAHIDALLKA